MTDNIACDTQFGPLSAGELTELISILKEYVPGFVRHKERERSHKRGHEIPYGTSTGLVSGEKQEGCELANPTITDKKAEDDLEEDGTTIQRRDELGYEPKSSPIRYVKMSSPHLKRNKDCE
eukprot:gnl/Chilomastix_caulleri/1807.p1 GENE.gnl/Chilomastix_caulleri/1807~~gnl/Chilomastix_caulleri/1807.p1  ORF type:complete len:122 (+),score=29.57 gnl/Chilomastix_caulleri/1807:90-455(+)